ncbi:hypothetical protein [Fusobacterium necrophorum]|uniref:hypothetical protein n=1 Tax=Fusobacterium necrophorum TaxID=859 RepID=UPI000787085B|nr:hypothetical protein [Fusobacterium necrophorum]AYV95957.1 hypothetical protein BWX37_10125 [Fusobacterium necrophorum subsp. funduliforme]KYL02259.1 hypothetical protein A2J06_10740 [Fusobacterium necrophorum subsp. funduliforme]
MAEFKREKFDRKNITKDVVSIPGLVDKACKKLEIGNVLAYNDTTKKWVKYSKETHATGLFLFGIVKNDVDVTSADTSISILVQGEVPKTYVKEVSDDEKLWALLAKQGIYVL